MLRKRKRPELSPVGSFQNPFGDEAAQTAEVMETYEVGEPTGCQPWLRGISGPPPILRRNK
jgi:hypothetical protein